MNNKLVYVLLICTLLASPTNSISRWFSATYNDLKFTLYRYAYCYNGLLPLHGANMTENDYLVNQMKLFLDQANYDNEQLANVTLLMDNICRNDSFNVSYPVSLSIDVNMFKNSHPLGKENRCNAIDDAMDAMYYVFRRAALNRSEPLDFSSIKFYPNETDRNITYGLVDLINTSWITSETSLDNICSLTSPIKEYVTMRSSNSTAEARSEPPIGTMGQFIELINRILDPVLGLQKRLYWEGTNRLGLIQSRLSSGLGSIRDNIGHGLNGTRQMLFGSRPKVNQSSSLINSTRDSFNKSREALSNKFNKPSSPVASTVTVLSSTPAPNKTSTSTSMVISSTNNIITNNNRVVATTSSPNSLI